MVARVKERCGEASRREFLGAAAVAPIVLPSLARGANDRITLGVIGTGGRGTAVMRGCLAVRGVQVVAVCDVQRGRRERAKAIAEQHHAHERRSGTYKGCHATGDFRDILAREDVDSVLIAPQDHWHGVIASHAAAAGKDIYCEKPLGVCIADCVAIRDAVRRYGRVFQTGTQQRSGRNFRFACELALNGYLGEVHTVEVAAPGPRYRRSYRGSLAPQPVPEGLDWDMFVGPSPFRAYNPGLMAWPDWYLIWDYCAGFIVNWGVHHLDIAHWGCPSFGASPFEVVCRGTYRDDGFCDNISGWRAEFHFARGPRLLFSDTGHPYQQGTRFRGKEGWVHVNRSGIWADPPSLLGVRLGGGDVRLQESSHHQADFFAAVRSRRDPVAPVEAGHVASTLGLVAEIAARLSRPLRWDWRTERFEDPEANRLLARTLRAPWRLI